ncbi:MAG: hypothetical protein WD696_06730 [Bryobacteraceae bacterium]
MRSIVAALVLFAIPAFAASLKLYLKDGSHQIVREYKVTGDRVRFYSLERSDWEEIPADLVDLKRTEREQTDRQETLARESALVAAEEKAERVLLKEIAQVPVTAGVFWLNGKEIKRMPSAESKLHTNKGRSILKVLSPVPVVAGKGTVEIEGEQSENLIAQDRPEFYIRLLVEERFGIVRLTPRKGRRIVERVTIVPITKEYLEEQDTVEVFRHQLEETLYKIWPTNPLAPGEYAVVQYTEGKMNIQIWDFSIRPEAPPNPQATSGRD